MMRSAAALPLPAAVRVPLPTVRIAFENTKPSAAVIAGMYPGFKDEVKENSDSVRRPLTASSGAIG